MKPSPQEEKKKISDSMKTTTNEPDDVTMTSKKNVTVPKFRQTIGKMIKKKKLFVKVGSLNKVEFFNEFYLPPPMSAERRPPMMVNTPQEMLRRRLSRPPCLVRTHCRDKVPPYDPTMCLPRKCFIMYCERCQSYSHTGRKQWFKLPSPSMLQEFLVNRIKFHIQSQRLQLKLLDSWILQLDPGHVTKSTIMLSLKLQFHAPSGDCHEKIFDVEFRIAKLFCSDCSCLIDERKLSTVVLLRQYVSDRRFLRSLEISVQRKLRAVLNIQKIKHTEHGVDFFFNNDKDAMTLSQYLTTQAPVKCNQMHKNIQLCDGSSSNGSSVNCQNAITAVVCPILPHDLVYLPLMVRATLGLQHMGPLAICLNMGAIISLVDPLNLKHCVINRNDYWKNPFESLKSGRDLVEYIVVDVMMVSREEKFTFADVQVVRDSDFGKKDLTMLAKTHLGLVLKPGDHVFGYNLQGLNVTGVDIENIKHLLPDVVLIRKNWLATEQPQPRGLMRKKEKSPEYEQFLRDLKSNPEALFNLSLDGGDGEKQNSEVSSGKPENVGLELEDLLADLALNDQENRDTSEKL